MIQKTNLMVVDSDLLLGECLTSVLSRQEDFSSVELVTDPSDVLSRLAYLQVCTVLVNINLPHNAAMELTRQIRSEFSAVKVIMIGLVEAESLVMRCIEAGASGYILEGESLDKLLKTISSVNCGETICSPKVAYYGFSRVAELTRLRRDLEVFEDANLTPREIEILQLIVDGMSNKQIAQHLLLSLCTVKNHVHNILEKLCVHSRSEAAYYAMHNGLRRTGTVKLDRASVAVLSKRRDMSEKFDNSFVVP